MYYFIRKEKLTLKSLSRLKPFFGFLQFNKSNMSLIFLVNKIVGSANLNSS